MIRVAIIAVSTLAGAAGAYFWQENHYETRLAEMAAEQAIELAQANANALAETQRLQKAKDDAERQAAKRLADARADAARAGVALGMLGDAADAAIRAANASHSACQSVVTASTDLLQQCSSRYRDVAAEADKWVSESIMLRDAWPR